MVYLQASILFQSQLKQWRTWYMCIIYLGLKLHVILTLFSRLGTNFDQEYCVKMLNKILIPNYVQGWEIPTSPVPLFSQFAGFDKTR